MSQFQQAHQERPIDFENLMAKQRQLLNNITLSTSTAKNTVAANKVEKSDDMSSGDEGEWISNWQFERIASHKKPTQGFNSIKTTKAKSDAPSVDNEGGVFYFERIQPTSTAPAISSVISTSDTDNAVATQGSQDNQKHDFDQDDFFLDMTIDNDDLFADLEAAADSNDDSEISLDDLMDMEVEDAQHAHDHDDKLMRSLNASGIHDVNDFLNKSTASAALMNDDDFEMMNNDNDGNGYSFSSPVTHKESVSSTMQFGAMNTTSSPTSVTHHMAPPAPPLLPSACSMSSASTRPALQQMRKMMTNLMNNGDMPRARQHDSRLPCAEGMDEMYLDTLRKLSLSMERSKKTRKSLSIPMQTMQASAHYSRSLCVNQIVQSVNTSSRHVDTCLRSVSMMGR